MQVQLPLYDFNGRKKTLTPYGKGLYELAKDNLNQLANGYENLNRRHASGSHLLLRVGCRKEFFEIVAQTIKFEGRTEYLKKEEIEALADLRNDEIDIAVTESMVSSNELISRKIFEGTSRILFHSKLLPNIKNFRDLQKDKDLLLKTPCIMHKSDGSQFDRLANNLKKRSSDFNCKALLEDWGSILGLVEAQIGFAVVPSFIKSNDKNLVGIDIPHAIIPRVTYFATYQKKLKKVDAFRKALEGPIHSW